jgi:hypothetical protein
VLFGGLFVAVFAVTTVLGMRQGPPAPWHPPYRFALPVSFKGLPADPDDPLVTRMQGATGGTLVMVYGSPSSGRVMAIAKPAVVPQPDFRLDAVLTGEAGSLAHPRHMDPGPLGGSMSCMTEPSALGAAGSAVCLVWDAGGYLLFSETPGDAVPITVDRVAADAREFRQAAERRA